MICIKCASEGKRKKATKGKYCDYHYDEGKAKRRAVLVPLRDYWHSLMGRCYKPEWTLYKWFGARGFTVHPDWHEKKEFIEWGRQQGYRKGMKLIVDGKEYGPDTCKFVKKEDYDSQREIQA